MPISTSSFLDTEQRSSWVRLRTLIVLRWIAICGQLAAIWVAQRQFNLDLNIGLCLLAVGVSVIANLVAIFVYPENKRLSEQEITSMLIFDISQLSALLLLTGGLNNPFALLILAPVTIAATALRIVPTILVGLVAIFLVTLVMIYNVPLRTTDNIIMKMPKEFVFGFWVAIIIGIIFLGAYAKRVTSEISSMSEALLATQMALAREQKITDLTGIVAATAHELGTPLATIKLTSSELMEDLDATTLQFEDAKLIRDQADRCRDILRSMGQAGNDDLYLHHAPLSQIVREAAEPHSDRGKNIKFSPEPHEESWSKQPEVRRNPEIIHGLRNLIQNAVDFSASTVWVDMSWSRENVTVKVIDDGPGYPPHVIGRIGDPFMRVRRSADDNRQRPEYEGMGLGLFIAKALLERTGAKLVFANGRQPNSEIAKLGQRRGAIVEVVWPADYIIPPSIGEHVGLGQNAPIIS